MKFDRYNVFDFIEKSKKRKRKKIVSKQRQMNHFHAFDYKIKKKRNSKQSNKEFFNFNCSK